MPFSNFMNKVRQLDNSVARWMLRHFYIIFFEFVLVIIFFFFIYNTFRTIDASTTVPAQTLTEQLLQQQSLNQLIIIILMILNSFWMLFIFSGINRLRILLKEISFNLLRSKNR
jgi:hypothetical protein